MMIIGSKYTMLLKRYKHFYLLAMDGLTDTETHTC